jgi:hypothetical protein
VGGLPEEKRQNHERGQIALSYDGNPRLRTDAQGLFAVVIDKWTSENSSSAG